MNQKLVQKIQNSPQRPGVYSFKSKSGSALYIGKTANLRSRLRQYLKKEAYSPFLTHILGEAEKIEYKTTDSEIEALLLESQLIKKFQPKYNIMLRDDKQYFYVSITKEEFPKIFLTHQAGELGPFTDGAALKTTLRLLRRIFPYCTCKQKHNNFCLNYHIEKCPGYCCLKTTTQNSKIYNKNIKAIKDILGGKKNPLIKQLEKELRELGKKKKFEEAINLRGKIKKLKQVFANAKILRDSVLQYANIAAELKKVFKLPRIPRRIESYDVSNIQGKNATGAMVVFIRSTSPGQANYQPDKNEYRKFKIIFGKTPNDTAMLKEVLARRLKHPEWPYPDLIFVDGGKGQLNTAIKIMKSPSFAKATGGIAVISLAKGKNEIFSSTLNPPAGGPVSMKNLPNEVKNLIQYLNKEAHRFAIGYYRKIHRRAVL